MKGFNALAGKAFEFFKTGQLHIDKEQSLDHDWNERE
jgi:hypothetical protein